MRLILLLLPLSFLTKADMDYVCYVDENNNPNVFIAENCQRNNVLHYTSTSYENQIFYISDFCRFDRNVERDKTSFTCVLYDKYARSRIDSFNYKQKKWIFHSLTWMLQIWRTFFVSVSPYVLDKIFEFGSYYCWSFICSFCYLSCSGGPWLVMGCYTLGIRHTCCVRIF